ncbi:MAG: hypothetical protein WCT53_03370, partial [Candidatus Gracilibacteria bacterium]
TCPSLCRKIPWHKVTCAFLFEQGEWVKKGLDTKFFLYYNYYRCTECVSENKYKIMDSYSRGSQNFINSTWRLVELQGTS